MATGLLTVIAPEGERWRRLLLGAVERVDTSTVGPVYWPRVDGDLCLESLEDLVGDGSAALIVFESVDWPTRRMIGRIAGSIAAHVLVGSVAMLGMPGEVTVRPRFDRELRRPDRLTDAERAVAHAVADGLSNQEAAASLFVSVKTIESHLTRIYRKLDLDRRSQLSRGLAGW